MTRKETQMIDLNRIERSQKYSAENPKSVCQCGHTGDGANSEHDDSLQAGHGACFECECVKFTWTKFTPEYDKMMKAGMN